MITTKITLNEHDCSHYRIYFVVDEVIAGSCSGLVYRNDKAKVMHIDDVFIQEGYRNKGYGTEMIREAVKFAITHHVDSVELTANEDNAIARRLYQKLGFVETNKKYCRRILNIK